MERNCYDRAEAAYDDWREEVWSLVETWCSDCIHRGCCGQKAEEACCADAAAELAERRAINKTHRMLEGEF